MVNADRREAEWIQGNHYKTHGDVCHDERQAAWEICQDWVKLELLGCQCSAKPSWTIQHKKIVEMKNAFIHLVTVFFAKQAATHNSS